MGPVTTGLCPGAGRMVQALIGDVVLAKQGLADALGLQSSLLHVPIGAALFGLLWVLLRGRRHAPAWAAFGVFAVECANEWIDALQWRAWTGAVNWAEAARDIVLTMAGPLVIVTAVGLIGARGPGV